MPRFVLLYHDCPPDYERSSHWDLMLECDGVLRTWAIANLPRDSECVRERTATSHPGCPPIAAKNAVVAEQLADHRIAYLELEGPLSGDRGEVIRVLSGAYSIGSESTDCLRFSLA